jgi:O-antigen ligase
MIVVATILCVAIAIVLPVSIRIAGITPFDVLAYTTILLLALRGIVLSRPWRGSPAAYWWVRAGIAVLVIGASIAYIARSQEFEASAFNGFLMPGNAIPHLYLRVCVYGLARLFLFLGALDLGRLIGSSPRWTRYAIGTLLAAASLNAVIALVRWYQETGGVLARYNFMPPIEESQGVHVDRMVLAFILAFGIWVRRRKGPMRERLLLLTTMVLTLCSIATVFVRQGWAMLVLLALWYVALSWGSIPLRTRVRAAFVAIVFFVTAASFIVARNQDLRDNLTSLTTSDSVDFQVRQSLISSGLSVFKSHPLLGVGYGAYFAYDFAPVQIGNGWIYVASAHNGIVMVLAESGLVGTLGFGILATALLAVCWRARKSASDNYARGLTTSILSILIASLLVHCIANSPFLPPPAEHASTQEAFLLWFLFGLSAGVAYVSLNKHPV